MLKVVCTKVVFMTTEDMAKGGKFLGEFKCTCSYFHTLCIFVTCIAMATNMTVSGCWTRGMDTDYSATPMELSTMYARTRIPVLGIQYQWGEGISPLTLQLPPPPPKQSRSPLPPFCKFLIREGLPSTT